jgi:hypothetical protein
MNVETPDWRNFAECLQSDPELWFARDGDYTSRCRAIAICGLCPVKAECLEAGMDEEFGIWGGLTARQRRSIRRNRRQTPAAGTERRLRALAHLGWTPSDVAHAIERRTGVPIRATTLRRIRSGVATYVHQDTARLVALVYPDMAERTSKAYRARYHVAEATERGWLSPDDWDGYDIDAPDIESRLAA